MPEAAASSSRAVVPHGVTWRGRLAAGLIYLLVRAIAATVRFRLEDGSGLLAGGPKGPLIFCIWHNRLALSLSLYRRNFFERDPRRHLAAMVSASKDGALLARILENFGAQPVRGSSSRRGPQALLELTTWAERGYDLAITPDGPRGPRYVVQDGIIALAQLTGLGILPVAYHQLENLSEELGPFSDSIPFAVPVAVGAMVHIPREASDLERAECAGNWKRRCEP